MESNNIKSISASLKLLFYYASTVIQCMSLAGFRWPGWKRIATGKKLGQLCFFKLNYLSSVESKNAHKLINVFLFCRIIRYLSLRVQSMSKDDSRILGFYFSFSSQKRGTHRAIAPSNCWMRSNSLTEFRLELFDL